MEITQKYFCSINTFDEIVVFSYDICEQKEKRKKEKEKK